MFGLRFPELVLMLLILFVVIVPWWAMVSKAGYNGALALALFIPLVNFVFLFWFAFSKWPVLRELEALRSGAAQPRSAISTAHPPV